MDDFYKSDAEIPQDTTTGYANWDSPEAFELERFISAIEYIRLTGSLPEIASIQEESVDVDFTPEQWARLKEKAPTMPITFVDGILMYSFMSKMDFKIFVRASYDQLKTRRAARSGYATIEGFWRDPPEYFEKIVWPEYVKSHEHLFENGNVNGRLIDPHIHLIESTSMLEMVEECLDILNTG